MDYIVHNGSGRAEIDGGDGTDTIFGGAAADLIHGGADGDDIDGRGGVDQLFGDGGDDIIHWDYADLVLGTVDGGAGYDMLEIVGQKGVDDFLHHLARRQQLQGRQLQGRRRGGLAHRRRTSRTCGSIRAPGPTRSPLDYMAGSGLSFIVLSTGKNVVRTGTELVTDESGQPIEQDRFSISDDGAPDTVTILGHDGDRTTSTLSDNTDSRTWPPASACRLGGLPTIVVSDSVRSEGDTLIVSTRGGDDSVERQRDRDRPRGAEDHRRRRQRHPEGHALQRRHRQRQGQRHRHRRPRPRRVLRREPEREQRRRRRRRRAHRRGRRERDRHPGREPRRAHRDLQRRRRPLQRPAGHRQPAEQRRQRALRSRQERGRRAHRRRRPLGGGRHGREPEEPVREGADQRRRRQQHLRGQRPRPHDPGRQHAASPSSTGAATATLRQRGQRRRRIPEHYLVTVPADSAAIVDIRQLGANDAQRPAGGDRHRFGRPLPARPPTALAGDAIGTIQAQEIRAGKTALTDAMTITHQGVENVEINSAAATTGWRCARSTPARR